MNRTHLEHTIIALAIQFALWPVLGPWGAGFTACAVFLGREIAQHEYKLALARGWVWGKRKPLAWYEGLLRGWSKDSVLDVLSPLVACAATAYLLEAYL